METARPHRHGNSLFVGRVHELSRLRDAFNAAAAGRGGVAFLAGEPGIGKTTLCRELATWVTGRNGLALIGHCDDAGELSIPYLPFVEALRSAVRTRAPADLFLDLGHSITDVARIVPELRERLSSLPTQQLPADPSDARHRLLQAVTAFLTALSASVPVLLVLEDLQDADHGTLDMLGYLSRHLADARLLVVGTFRSTEVDRAHSLTGTLVRLRRHIQVGRLILDGLSAEEVHDLVGGIAERAGTCPAAGQSVECRRFLDVATALRRPTPAATRRLGCGATTRPTRPALPPRQSAR